MPWPHNEKDFFIITVLLFTVNLSVSENIDIRSSTGLKFLNLDFLFQIILLLTFLSTTPAMSSVSDHILILHFFWHCHARVACNGLNEGSQLNVWRKIHLYRNFNSEHNFWMTDGYSDLIIFRGQFFLHFFSPLNPKTMAETESISYGYQWLIEDF